MDLAGIARLLRSLPAYCGKRIALCAGMATSLRQLQATALALGVELVENGTELEAWTPIGQVFAANGCHCIVVPYEFTNVAWPATPRLIPGTTADCRQDVADQLAMGLEPCTVPDCDTCEAR